VRSTWRLALRVNRGPLIAWAVAFVTLGLVYGRFATSADDILADNPAVTSILAAGATTPDALRGELLVTILSLIGIVAAVPGVQTMLKVRFEEMSDRVEPLLATAVARPRYYASNVALALLESTVYLLIASTIMGLLIADSDLGLTFDQVLVQAIAVIPAVWTITAISVTVVGARPQARLAAWVGVLASFVLTLLGPSFGLDDWVLAISPFWHVPVTTFGSPDLSGLVWISMFTVGFLVLGFAGFRHRDLAR
jgi:ABC-2 type transport system permease protein